MNRLLEKQRLVLHVDKGGHQTPLSGLLEAGSLQELALGGVIGKKNIELICGDSTTRVIGIVTFCARRYHPELWGRRLELLKP